MIKHSEKDILHGLQLQDPDILKFLYKEFFPIAKSIVEKNSGNYGDAQDVFQDSIIVLYQKICSTDLQITCSLKTFFYSVCRNIWKQRLDRKWRLVLNDEIVNEPGEGYEPEYFTVDELKLEKLRLFYYHFMSLPCDCQKVLTLFMGEIPQKEIAKFFGYKDETYVKTKKYLCKEMLRKRIMKDPLYNSVFKDE